MFRLLDHDAEIGILACAESLPELAVEASRALIRIMTEDAIPCEEWEEVSVEADDTAHALVNLLNELVWRVSVHERVYTRFTFTVEEEEERVRIHGRMCGAALGRITPRVEVKAVTYSGLRYWKEHGQYCFRVIVDI